MVSDNPYLPPQNGDPNPPTSILFLMMAAVFGSALVGGSIGLVLGAALGTYSPGYYRSVFSNGDSPNFDPVAVGIGQGLTQGIVFGAFIGLILVAMFYWARYRSQNHSK